jgi:NAD(P)-dependent dehydrogenase (short-subunit alcohol dehydrogenase family)
MISLQSYSLQGKTAIVTGAGQGIGKGIAEALAALGANVVIAEVNEATCKKTADEIKAKGQKALAAVTDVLNPASVEKSVQAAVKTFGQIDILVNNAGGMGKTRPKPLVQMTEEDWDFNFALNAKAHYITIHAIAPVMIKQGKGGSIVNIASIGGSIGHENLIPYGAAKASLINMTAAVAGELGPHGIRVNAVSPGTVVTPLTQAAEPLRQGFTKMTADMTPLRRLGNPDDIAGAVAFLCSPAASFITAINMLVDGGRLGCARIPMNPVF